MPTLATWSGRSEFQCTGSVHQGTKISYGNSFRFSKTITAAQYADLLHHFQGRTVDIGTSRTDPPQGSVGKWLQANVTKTAMASYVGPILLSERYAVKVGRSQIKFI